MRLVRIATAGAALLTLSALVTLKRLRCAQASSAQKRCSEARHATCAPHGAYLVHVQKCPVCWLPTLFKNSVHFSERSLCTGLDGRKESGSAAKQLAVQLY